VSAIEQKMPSLLPFFEVRKKGESFEKIFFWHKNSAQKKNKVDVYFFLLKVVVFFVAELISWISAQILDF
jgi:hypothetical protein